jgi:hypothetical protein
MAAAAVVVYSLEGRGLKLNTAEDARPYADELAVLVGVTDVRLNGNTLSVEAAQVLGAALARHTTVQVPACPTRAARTPAGCRAVTRDRPRDGCSASTFRTSLRAGARR